MYSEILSELGLAKNESFIYITLVKFGGLPVATIALKSGVHRRNVYDSMQRLIERGLVYEEVGNKENVYFAVDPNKLLEMVEEKRSKVESLMPELLKQFKSSMSEQSIAVYSGIEGVKNYLRHMERENKEIYLYGVRGASLSSKVEYTFKHFVSQLEKNKIKANVLYRHDVIKNNKEAIGHCGKTSHSRILSEKFDDSATYTVFGDYVYVESGQYTKKNLDEGGEVVLFMIKSKSIADMMRNMFNCAWEVSKEYKK